MESQKCARFMCASRRTAPSSRSANGRRPLSPQEWFNCLSDKAGNDYQPLSGGRGVFRLTRTVVDALKAE